MFKKHRGKSFTQGVVKKVGSLAETMPELSKEWHPTKNGDLTPNDITAGKLQTCLVALSEMRLRMASKSQ
jgi:hypothetical protein